MMCNWVRMAYSGINIMTVGIKYAISTDVPSRLDPRHFSRTSAYAPRLAANSEMMVTTVLTSTVFAYQLTNGTFVNRYWKCSRVHGLGQNMSLICWICSVLLNDVMNTK